MKVAHRFLNIRLVMDATAFQTGNPKRIGLYSAFFASLSLRSPKAQGAVANFGDASEQIESEFSLVQHDYPLSATI